MNDLRDLRFLMVEPLLKLLSAIVPFLENLKGFVMMIQKLDLHLINFISHILQLACIRLIQLMLKTFMPQTIIVRAIRGLF